MASAAATSTAAPLTATTQASTMREVLASIPGFSVKPRRRSNKKMSTAAQIEQTKDGKIDLETPDSILTATNLRDLLNKQTFSMLKPLYQYNLIQLLPRVDREAIELEQQKQTVVGSAAPPIRLTSSSLNNEFFARACLEWRERLSEGEFTPENQMRLKTEAEREKNKLDPWKLKHFEPLWGERSPAATRNNSSTFIRNNSSSSGCSSSSSSAHGLKIAEQQEKQQKQEEEDKKPMIPKLEIKTEDVLAKIEVKNENENEEEEEAEKTCDNKDTNMTTTTCTFDMLRKTVKNDIHATKITTANINNNNNNMNEKLNAEKRSLKRTFMCSPAKRRKTNSGGSEQLITETIDLEDNDNDVDHAKVLDTTDIVVDSTKQQQQKQQQQNVPEVTKIDEKSSEKQTNVENVNKSDNMILDVNMEEEEKKVKEEEMAIEVLLEESVEDVTKAQLETDNVQIADNLQQQQQQQHEVDEVVVEQQEVEKDEEEEKQQMINDKNHLLEVEATQSIIDTIPTTTTTSITITTTTTSILMRNKLKTATPTLSNTCDNIVCTPTLVTPISNNNNNNNNHNINSNNNLSNNGLSSDSATNTNTTVAEILPDLELTVGANVIEDDEMIAQQFADAENYVLESSVGVVQNDTTTTTTPRTTTETETTQAGK